MSTTGPRVRLAVTLVLAAACSERPAPPMPAPAPTAPAPTAPASAPAPTASATPASAPAPTASATPASASTAPPAPTPPSAAPSAAVRPEDVLEGPAAAEAMAEAAAAAPAAPAAAVTDWGVRPQGLGPLIIGAPWARLSSSATALGCVALPAGSPAKPGERTHTCGAPPWLRIHVVDGRLRAVHVLARDPRALTDESIGVGSTIEDAVLAHGEPREVPGGWVLEALPGVRVRTRDPDGATAPTGVIIGLDLVGAAALAPED